VLTDRPGTLTNDVIANLLDMGTEWKPVDEDQQFFQGRDRKSGAVKWTASRVDLAFGSNSELRAVAEVYGGSDAQAKFVEDFAAAWNKVMMLDRFEVKR
jgi:catalase-peroxidase